MAAFAICFATPSGFIFLAPKNPTIPIPISAPPPESSQQIATPTFHVFISRLHATVRHGFSQRRPWLELLDRSAFSRPDSLSDAVSRIRRNFSYFRVNYISLLALSLAFSLISHPFSLLIILSLLAAWSTFLKNWDR